MTLARRNRIRALLKGIETGDPHAVEVINPDLYIQHNPQTHEGREGLAALFKRLSETNPRVNIVRAFSDGDHVFAHTEYDFSTRRIGFEVFRFEGDMTVEHWDNIQPRLGPNASGRTMVDGPTEAEDHHLTERNRATARAFVEAALIGQSRDAWAEYVDADVIQHDPVLVDGLAAWRTAMEATTEVTTEATTEATTDGRRVRDYVKLHRVLAEGNFVLSVTEGTRDGKHTAFYDLVRLKDDRIVEHWNTVEGVAPQSEWKNDNGKF